MKTLHYQLLPYVLFSLSFLPFIAFSIRQFPLPPVISVDGKEVKLGKSYFISYTLFPPLGVCLVDNVKCPKDIIQCPSYYDDPRGLPVTFSAVVNSTEDTVVREDTPYRIEFSAPGNCSDENFWYLKNEDGYADNDFVAIGPKKLANEFIVQKVESGYKIIQCILIPIPPTPICYDVGFLSTYGYNRLGIGFGVQPAQFFFAIATFPPSPPSALPPSPSALPPLPSTSPPEASIDINSLYLQQ